MKIIILAIVGFLAVSMFAAVSVASDADDHMEAYRKSKKGDDNA